MKTHAILRAFLGLTLCLATTAFSAQVTFQVNMSAQAALGNFDPTTDTVFVAGDPINAWSTTESPLAPSASDTNVWIGTFDVSGTAGSTAQYKFLLTTASATVWEGNVGSGGGTGNRTFILADTNQTLPVVFFNNVTNSTTVSVDVTFQVDMSVQTTLGAFDPDSGTVSLAGEFNAWDAAAFPLTRSASSPNLWVGTLKLTGAADSSVSYKFVMNGGTWEGNVGVNGAQNRALTLKKTAQTLPPVFFSNTAVIPSVIPVTFQVNLAPQIALGSFNPDTDTVSVAGDLLNNWSATGSVLTRSDANTNLWTGTFDINGTTGNGILFKYVLNGSTWESIDNRAYTLLSTNAHILPPVFFDNPGNLGKITPSAVTEGQLTLTWTAGPLIRLQTATDMGSGAWQDVPNTLGQGSAKVPVGAGPAFFRLVEP